MQQVDKITQLYRDRGYPLSFALVQNQTFANGLVVVTVVEGYIGTVRIEGDLGNAQDRLESLAEPLKEEKPLKQATLERVLNLMRTVPGVKFTPSLDLPPVSYTHLDVYKRQTHSLACVFISLTVKNPASAAHPLDPSGNSLSLILI